MTPKVTMEVVRSRGRKSTYNLEFPLDLETLRAMHPIARATMVEEFLVANAYDVVELFSYRYMPDAFKTRFLKHRSRETIRDAFRKAMADVCKPPAGGEQGLIENVLDYVRRHGSFSPSELGKVLGRPATEGEHRAVDEYFSKLSDEELQAVLKGPQAVH